MSIYNIYKFQNDKLKNKRDWYIENQEYEKFLDDYRKLTSLFPVGLIFSDTTIETLLTGISFI